MEISEAKALVNDFSKIGKLSVLLDFVRLWKIQNSHIIKFYNSKGYIRIEAVSRSKAVNTPIRLENPISQYGLGSLSVKDILSLDLPIGDRLDFLKYHHPAIYKKLLELAKA
jgi:hypothetical protein